MSVFLATLVGHHDAYICTGKYGISRNALMIDLKGLYYSTILDQKGVQQGSIVYVKMLKM